MLEDAVEGIASYYRMTLERFQPIMLYESVPTRRFMRNKATKVQCAVGVVTRIYRQGYSYGFCWYQCRETQT